MFKKKKTYLKCNILQANSLGSKLTVSNILIDYSSAFEHRQIMNPLPAQYLFLPQNEDPSGLDRVPGGKVDPGPLLHAVLVGLPLSIPGRPGHTHVVPLAPLKGQRERHGLRMGQSYDYVLGWYKTYTYK